MSSHDWVGSQGDAAPDGHQMPEVGGLGRKSDYVLDGSIEAVEMVRARRHGGDLVSTPDLGELRRLLEAATPSEWVAQGGMVVASPGPLAKYIADCFDEPGASEDDAALIAAAINALPALLDDLEAAHEEIATLTAQRDRADRRHERLESGVEALAGEYQRAIAASPPRGGEYRAMVFVVDDLRALLAEGGASEERA